MKNYQYMQEGEIDLKTCAGILIKRKELVLAILILSLVASVLACLWIPKVYEASSTIQLGSIDGFLIKKEEVKDLILNQNSLSTVIKELNLKVRVKDLKKSIIVRDVADTNLLVVRIIYPDLKMALKINAALINSFIIQGQSMYQEQFFLIGKRLNRLDDEIKGIKKMVKRKKVRIFDDFEAKNNLFEFWAQRNELNFLIVNAKDFKIIQPPIVSKNPVVQKNQKIFIVGGVTLLLGLLLVFFIEFYRKDKKGEIR